MEQIGTLSLFLIFFIFHGFFLSILMAVGHLIVHKRTLNNVLFTTVFFAIALLEIHFFFYETGLLPGNPWVQVLNIPVFYTLGPILYFLLRRLENEDNRIGSNQLFHLLPAGAALIGNGIAVFGLPASEGKILPGYFHNSLSMLIGFGGFILLAFYIIWIWKIIIANRLWKRSFLKQQPSAAGMMVFIGLLTLGWGIDAAAVVLNSKIIFESAVFVLTLAVVLLFFVHFRHPEFFRVFQDKMARERQRRSQLKGLNLKAIESGISSLMCEEELYLESRLTLPELAERLEITTHQLSEFINHRFQVNFPAYINRFRVEKSKQMLLENPDETILSIAYESGFESKSTFNDVFQKMTGMTPSQFRKTKP